MSQRASHGFESPFLRDMERHFYRRAKSLRHRGRLTIEGEQRDDGESWLEVVLVTSWDMSIVIVLNEDNKVNVFVRSTRSVDRGRILFRVHDLRVPSNGKAVVSAYEKTVSLSGDLEMDKDVRVRIEKIWASLALRVETS